MSEEWNNPYNDRLRDIDETWGLLTAALRDLINQVESCDGTSQVSLQEAKAAMEAADRLSVQSSGSKE